MKIVLGHPGETIPFQLERIDNRWAAGVRGGMAKRLKKLPSQYFKDYFVVSASGMFTHAQLLLTFDFGIIDLGRRQRPFCCDYPAENLKEAATFMNTAPISDDDKEKIYHLNAERVFSLG
ncbi:MAG: hypothetical protein ABSD13_13825 [Candidatus Korobacteraceae bacterium]